MSGTLVLEETWPMLGRHVQAAGWPRVWTDLGRTPRTIDAYPRGLAEYLEMYEREGVDPLTASRAHVGVYVRELTNRPIRRGANGVSLDSGSGAGQRHHCAAAGAGAAVLRPPHGGD
ncbi:hypothetical protein ACFWAY_48120 [Rhodococcus sp. NPDC059968]|uniref:hypothetical protein n=1 Tax=Rhodococcus sp. NPDC059968 TaxID=3347017 RepID=UPI003670218B